MLMKSWGTRPWTDLEAFYVFYFVCVCVYVCVFKRIHKQWIREKTRIWKFTHMSILAYSKVEKMRKM